MFLGKDKKKEKQLSVHVDDATKSKHRLSEASKCAYGKLRMKNVKDSRERHWLDIPRKGSFTLSEASTSAHSRSHSIPPSSSSHSLPMSNGGGSEGHGRGGHDLPYSCDSGREHVNEQGFNMSRVDRRNLYYALSQTKIDEQQQKKTKHKSKK
jgi:hypothetical protein